MENGPDIEALRARAVEGDSAAREALLGAIRPRVLRWALVRAGDGDDAEDLTQDVLVRVSDRLESFEGRSSFMTWLYRVVRNAAVERARRKAAKERAREGLKRRLAVEGPSHVSGTNGGWVGDGESVVEIVRLFMNELPAKQREAFNLVDLEGMGPNEAAEVLGSNPSTLRVHLLRARRRIRQAILDRAPEVAEGRG